MTDFPAFMKKQWSLVPASEQNTSDIVGHYVETAEGVQVAFWICHSDQLSAKHRHEFDEYMVCLGGQFVVHLEEGRHVLNPGDELHIPKGTLQWSEVKAGTRSLHVFGGRRIPAKKPASTR